MSKRGQLSSEPLLWRLFALLTFSFLRGVGTTGAGNQQMKTVTRRAKKMTDTDLPWPIFGRRMRPYSFALSISTSVITWSIFAGSTIGQLLDATLGQFAGIVGIVTVLLLIGGFWFRSDRLMTIGLLLSAGLWNHHDDHWYGDWLLRRVHHDGRVLGCGFRWCVATGNQSCLTLNGPESSILMTLTLMLSRPRQRATPGTTMTRPQKVQHRDASQTAS